MRRATVYCWPSALYWELYFYPRSPCGERPVLHASSTLAGYISTHALHAESDRIPRFVIFDKRFISTHALHAESDAALYVVSATSRIFLPTLSMRRATSVAIQFFHETPISTHALHAESDCFTHRIFSFPNISTHALHAESDGIYIFCHGTKSRFLPTLSMRRATKRLMTIDYRL